MEISVSSRQMILAAVARAIIMRLTNQPQLPIVLPDEPALSAQAGCFVSLHRSDTHHLRGCIGVVENPRSLREILIQTAESALSDPRFVGQPITAAEIDFLDVELTLLGPLIPAASPLHFEPLVHGIFLTAAGKSGLFLPQVARTTGWNREQLLDRLCYEKLGLAPKAWRLAGAALRTFTADIIGPAPLRLAAGM
jgi:AmmeMemoRadiSam system protein A